jgi:NhaP-type Na+/H+ or K+/H+ antiporter
VGIQVYFRKVKLPDIVFVTLELVLVLGEILHSRVSEVQNFQVAEF